MRPDELIADKRVQREVLDMRAKADSAPLSVAIMGQTGVGKSSLLNALFSTDLAIGDIAPTTKIPEPVQVFGSSGHPITFWDMPGFGESDSADASYLEMYRSKVLACDVVLWALHSDSRSTTYDAVVLEQLLRDADDVQRGLLRSKLTFVLTKADLLSPPPWVFLMDGAQGSFTPGKALDQKMAEKSQFFESTLLAGLGDDITSRTFLPDPIELDDPRFTVERHHILFHGYFDDPIYSDLAAQFPKRREMLDRLRDNHRVLICSAAYRFGLIRLLSVIVNKIGRDATGRFQRLVSEGSGLELVPTDAMRRKGPFVVWDTRRGRKSFDLDDVKFR